MAHIHPFSALLFAPESGNDVTAMVAPPFDVIDAAARTVLVERHPHNVVRLILPADAPGKSRYEVAARLFHAWQKEGRLVPLEGPALYLWEQEFAHAGVEYRRRALVARVSCEPYRLGGVMRHEHTQKAPKEDRLRLFQATSAQFSQIFGLFPDPAGEVSALLGKVAAGEPLITARGDDGQLSRLYPIAAPADVGRLQAALKDATITIADGHHRYETSLAYHELQGRAGRTLMTLVPAGDPGLLVLPTHRTVPLPLRAAALIEALAPRFVVSSHPFEEWPALTWQPGDGGGQTGIIAVPPGGAEMLQVKWDPADRSLDHSFQHGDAAVLHEHLLPQAQPETPLQAKDFRYLQDAHAAVAAARDDGLWAFLLRPTPVATLLKVAEHQRVLPSKSTYVYPKFLSGFVNALLD